MNKSFNIITAILFCTTINAQVLYTENFNNYAVGNVGTDPTGIIPGKGGWLTESFGLLPHTNDAYKITNEANRGNVLTISAGTTSAKSVGNQATKVNLQTLIDQRTPGNNVLKFEIDFFTGAKQDLTPAHLIILGYDSNPNTHISNTLLHYAFRSNDAMIYAKTKDHQGPFQLDKNNVHAKLPFNSWVTFIVYLDYNNKKAYYETPYFNTITAADFLKSRTSTNLIEDFKPTYLNLFYSQETATSSPDMLTKYDNIKITALKSVPAYVLSAENFLADTFNVFPNPAESVIHITNTNNLYVENVIVYDISGKEIKNQTFANETNIQLNIENLASGTYMLHLQTNEGLAVKKIVKK